MYLKLIFSVGYNEGIALKQPGKEFREMRKELSAAVGKGGAPTRDKHLHQRNLGLYLSNLLRTPDHLFMHNRWYVHYSIVFLLKRVPG
jgi:hypothetical protein